MRALLLSVAVCVAIGVIVFAVTGGHVVFLPLVFLLPLGLLAIGRRQTRSDREQM
jgi:hypothetical protein